MAKKKKQRNNKPKHANHQEDYSKKILSLLRKNPDKPLNYKQIASQLGVDNPDARNQIVKNLSKLAGQSKIDPVDRGKYKIQGGNHSFEGVLDMTTRGDGFVIVEELAKDIFIPHRRLNKALDGDTVRIYCFDDPKKHKPNAEITEIIKRKKDTFVGILHLKDTFGFVEMNNPKMYTDIFVPRNNIKNAKDGMVVLTKIVDWAKDASSPAGKIIKVLGTPGEHETEMQSILAESGLPSDFPQEVEDFADKIDTRIHKSEIKKRRDMRKTLTFTIDPKDAKDFDDALSFEKLENGNYQIGIHIADVSHYVQPGNILDEEAYERGTSIYLVDRVVPMLPEILSNKACSLRPDEEKFTFSAVFELDQKGNVLDQWFGRTTTLSNARFAYEEAQHIIESQSKEIPKETSISGKAYSTSDDILKAVLTLNDLAQKMRSNRMQNGAISFDKVEVKFNLNKENEPTGVYFKQAKEANKLIEEFMLLANRKVAEFIGKQKPEKTFIYRCHNQPDEEKLVSLQNLVGQFGYTMNLKNRKTTSQSLNNLLQDVQGKKEQNLVDTLAIRTMSKAYYSTENIGHYGLAFDYYSHFTSPIRRYPDVMTHRLLQHYLDNGQSANQEDYEVKCKHCSQSEVFSTNAERDSIKYMQVKFMKQHQNKMFLGVISGVTDFGIFIEIVENKCEGMVRLRDIEGDHFIFDQEQYAVIGRRTQKRYQLGDEVYVKVKKADIVKRNLDFELVGTKENQQE